jgi:hypothetical protein
MAGAAGDGVGVALATGVEDGDALLDTTGDAGAGDAVVLG